MSDEADIVRAWMRDVLEAKGWSPERWARNADTTPTNLTRFLRGGPHVPSTRTIAKLAAVAGYGPPIGRLRLALAGQTVTVYPTARDAALKQRKLGEIIAMVAVSQEAFAIRFTGDAPLPPGAAFSAGDVLVLEPPHILPPIDGDYVVLANGDGSERIALCAGASFLVGASDARRSGSVEVLGIVVAVTKVLRAGYDPMTQRNRNETGERNGTATKPTDA